MVDLTIGATLVKGIRTKDPLQITNKLMHVLSGKSGHIARF